MGYNLRVSYDPKGVYTLSELATIMGVSMNTMYSWAKEGKFTWLKDDGIRKVNIRQVAEFVKERLIKAQKKLKHTQNDVRRWSMKVAELEAVGVFGEDGVSL